MCGGGDAECGACADEGGTDVEGGAFGFGDPAGFELDETFDEDEKGGGVEGLDKMQKETLVEKGGGG